VALQSQDMILKLNLQQFSDSMLFWSV